MAADPGPARPALSLVIPAYNEANRLGETFTALNAWLDNPPCAPVEILLVDDGSQDETAARFEEFARGREQVRVLRNPHKGKAFTVRSGMLAAQGDLILFSDCDLSTPLEEASVLMRAILDQGFDVAIGSRELSGSTREDEPFYRHLMGRGFNYLVQGLLVRGIRDTQCGFKMFRREAAHTVFSRLSRYGPDAPEIEGPMVTAFDVEVLFLAHKLGYRIAEIPVRWVHAEGSKVSPVRDSLRMARDVLLVKLGHLRGRYD